MTIGDRALRASWVPSLLGMMLAGLALVLGFEEPVEPLLWLSAVMVFFGPLLIAGHLLWTRELSADDKRSWMRHLVSWRAGAAVTSYTQRSDRRAALKELRRT